MMLHYLSTLVCISCNQGHFLTLKHVQDQKIRKLTLTHYHLILKSIQVFQLPKNVIFKAKGSSSESSVAFRCHVLLVSFNLEQFLVFP